ncbi:hypothetical protein [Methanohalobium evestigatum]|nr:hypothetical protein [Methanohalobium evestigatum]
MYNSNSTGTDLKERSHSSPSSRRESPATNWVNYHLAKDQVASEGV